MAKSILQKGKDSCLMCGSNQWIEEHHVFSGSRRKLSEKYGLKVYLCHFCHNEPPRGVHHNSDARKAVQQFAQEKAMGHYQWSVDDFRSIFGKNYL